MPKMSKASQARERLWVIKEVELNPVFVALQLQAAKQCGCDVSNALAYVGEQLTVPECFAMEDFWNWLNENNLAFGSGNIQQQWNAWKKSLEAS